MKRVSALSALALFACTTSARADTPPSLWDAAKDAEARSAYLLHVQVEQLREAPAEDRLGAPALEARRMERARELLIDGHAETSRDVRLRFDLGEIDERLERHEEAIRILTPALAEAPTHPASIEAWLSLAYAHAKLDQPREERAAYEGYLRLALDDRERLTAVLNLAEANMRDGRLDEAVAGYRDAVRLSIATAGGLFTHGTEALAEWGLAVALDRAGDPAAAAEAARTASGLDPRGMGFGRRQHIEDMSQVFFIPRYERLWYLALGESADAKAALAVGRARHAAYLYRRVEQMWTLYIDRAEHAVVKDRWIPLARAHRVRAHADRVAAEARAASNPGPWSPEEEELPPVDTSF